MECFNHPNSNVYHCPGCRSRGGQRPVKPPKVTRPKDRDNVADAKQPASKKGAPKAATAAASAAALAASGPRKKTTKGSIPMAGGSGMCLESPRQSHMLASSLFDI
jgi:hypothetical protein